MTWWKKFGPKKISWEDVASSQLKYHTRAGKAPKLQKIKTEIYQLSFSPFSPPTYIPIHYK